MRGPEIACAFDLRAGSYDLQPGQSRSGSAYLTGNIVRLHSSESFSSSPRQSASMILSGIVGRTLSLLGERSGGRIRLGISRVDDSGYKSHPAAVDNTLQVNAATKLSSQSSDSRTRVPAAIGSFSVGASVPASGVDGCVRGGAGSYRCSFDQPSFSSGCASSVAFGEPRRLGSSCHFEGCWTVERSKGRARRHPVRRGVVRHACTCSVDGSTRRERKPAALELKRTTAGSPSVVCCWVALLKHPVCVPPSFGIQKRAGVALYPLASGDSKLCPPRGIGYPGENARRRASWICTYSERPRHRGRCFARYPAHYSV